jgi:hypothetical protein
LGVSTRLCLCLAASGDDVLNWLSFGHTSIRKTLGSEARILAFYYYLTYCILKAGKPKFEAIQAPGVAAKGAGSSSSAAAAAAGVKQNGSAAAAQAPEQAQQEAAAEQRVAATVKA